MAREGSDTSYPPNGNGGLQARFHAAAEGAKKLPAATNADKLRLYGLYKQAIQGDAPLSAPSQFSMTARAKWEAWSRHRTIARDAAMHDYISLVRSLFERSAHNRGDPETSPVWTVPPPTSPLASQAACVPYSLSKAAVSTPATVTKSNPPSPTWLDGVARCLARCLPGTPPPPPLPTPPPMLKSSTLSGADGLPTDAAGGASAGVSDVCVEARRPTSREKANGGRAASRDRGLSFWCCWPLM